MGTLESIKRRIDDRDYSVGVVGLGYVGLPLLMRLGEVGFKAIGFDVDTSKTEKVSRGESYLSHIEGSVLYALTKSGRVQATVNFERLSEPDAILICVPTPLTRHRDPDLQYVEAAADSVSRSLRPGQLVVLESTTYPGTTEEIVLPRLLQSGLELGRDFYLAYSPEREDPGNLAYKLATTPKVIGGATPSCLDLACALYSCFIEKVVPVGALKVAEATKLLENIYRGVNIAMVNELKMVFDRMNIDIWDVIEAAKSKPFGYQAFYPGPGLGGHCIPVDPFYLTWKSREYGLPTRFIELAGEINTAMPAYVVQKLAEALNTQGKAMNRSRVLVLGVAYKRDVDDIRESPALMIMNAMNARGVHVSYSDPFVPALDVEDHSDVLVSVEITAECIQQQDAILLVTDHSSFPYQMLFDCGSLIVDSRNAFGRLGLHGPHVVVA